MYSTGWFHGGLGWQHDGRGMWWHPEHGYRWGAIEPFVTGVQPTALHSSSVSQQRRKAPTRLVPPKTVPGAHRPRSSSSSSRPSIMSPGYSAWAQKTLAAAKATSPGWSPTSTGSDAASGAGWFHGGYGWLHDGYGTWWHPEHGFFLR
jgi:hypothetical protein